MKRLKRIAIHSAPRSGSTWLGSIFDSHPEVLYKLQPLFSYALKDRLSPHSNLFEINEFFEDLVHSEDDFMDQVDAKKRGIIPSFNKSDFQFIVYKEVRYHHILRNLLEQDDSLKVVGIIRNPLSVIDSWLKAPKEFRADLGWKVDEEWRFARKKNLSKPEEFNGYEKWKEVALIFLELKAHFPDRFYLIQYSNLIANTHQQIEEVFKFCDLDFSKSTRSFIQNSTSKSVDDAYGVYRNKQIDSKWQNSLSHDIVSYIEQDLAGTDLEKYLN